MGRLFDHERYGACIGRVIPDGRVYDHERYGTCIGRAEGPVLLASGAAMLLIC